MKIDYFPNNQLGKESDVVQQVKVGDKIIYKSYSNTDVKIDGTTYILVREEDIMATVA